MGYTHTHQIANYLVISTSTHEHAWVKQTHACSSTPTSTDRGFAESVRLAEEVGVLKGGCAPSQLLRQVAVEALGGTGGGRPAGALPGLGQLQALHLLGHQPREVSAPRARRKRGGFIPSFFHLIVVAAAAVHRKPKTRVGMEMESKSEDSMLF